jgi:pimeloyl-ACP methyl ester carboxylesterase
MKEGFLDSMGYKVHFCSWGTSGSKILLIHSMGMDGHSMDKLANSLKDKYHVLSLTILDHGDSQPLQDSMRLPNHSEIMRECYLQLNFHPSVLIGHSVGGMMGMILTAEYPDEFNGLVLVDIAPFEPSGRPGRPAPPEYFETELDAKKWITERYPGFTDYYVENRLKYAFKRKDGYLWLKPRGEQIRDLGIDLWPYVKRIKNPVMLQIGIESDLVTPETRTRMDNTLPDIEIVVVEGTGHMIPQDVPDKFEELVRRFLKKIKH